MGKFPRRAVCSLVVVVVAAVLTGAMPAAAQSVPAQDVTLTLGRSLENQPGPVTKARGKETATSASCDAGLEQIQQVCSETRTQYPFSALVTDNFVLLHCGNDSWATSTANHLERTYNRFYSTLKNAGFSLKPLETQLTWVCFGSTDDYYRYAWQTERRDVSALEGYYSAQTNRVALYETSPAPVPHTAPAPEIVVASLAGEPLGAAPQLMDAARSTHEAAHQLAFNTGLQRRGVMYPFWLSEGLATAFEDDPADPSSASEIADRQRRLLDARAVNSLIPAGEFSIMTRIPLDDMGRVYDAYAQAWGFYSFLLEKHPSELNYYVARLESVEPGRRSPERIRREFTDSFGPVKPLEKQWAQYLDGLESVP